MINTFRLILLSLFMIGVSSCSGDKAWDEMPIQISRFVSRYFPEQGISSFGNSNEIYHVKIRNGAAISFDSDYQWISVNGFGSVLPRMFLFDELPPALYEYLQGMNEVDSVYAVSRDKIAYDVTLLDSAVTYDIATGKISGNTP